VDLNQVPDRDWFQFVVFSGESKSGSFTFIRSEPTLSGKRLQFTVRTTTWQTPSGGVLSKRRREAEAQQASAAAAKEQLREAREQLNKLDEG
jgi:hypothetical protein